MTVPGGTPPERGSREALLVVGNGRLGRSLARALDAAGHEVSLVAARRPASEIARDISRVGARSVFLAIPDGALTDVAAALAGEDVATGLLFVHLSGAVELTELDPLRRTGHEVGAFHPLQSFATEREPDAFRGILVAVDASTDEALERLINLATSIGARARRVRDEQRALYHAAAVLASNYVVTLISQAAGALEALGWTRDDALLDLLPLVQGVVENVRREGLPAALTGPIRRGDAATVSRNLAALELESPAAESVYRIVGLAALELAREAGLPETAAAEVRTALTRKEQRPGGAT